MNNHPVHPAWPAVQAVGIPVARGVGARVAHGALEKFHLGLYTENW